MRYIHNPDHALGEVQSGTCTLPQYVVRLPDGSATERVAGGMSVPCIYLQYDAAREKADSVQREIDRLGANGRVIVQKRNSLIVTGEWEDEPSKSGDELDEF